MGASREVFIGVLVEPALLLALLTVALKAGSTNLNIMSHSVMGSGILLRYVFAAIAFLIVVIAETGRIPVDNPDTHLELTMIHEGMLLEYSGRQLGLLFWASFIKQLVIILLFVQLFIPGGLTLSMPWNILWLTGKVIIMAILLAGIETTTNKMRLFRVPRLLMVSCLFSLLALVAQ
jgi:formate hydrogenlyase subunit 4